MTREIGHIVNPNTGVLMWFEPENVSALELVPTTIQIQGNPCEVEFSLSNSEEDKTIIVSASLEHLSLDNVIHSDPISICENKFAKILADSSFALVLLDENVDIKELKKKALTSITQKLFDEKILISDISIPGIGLIKANNKIFMTTESLSVTSGNRNTNSFTFSNCIGSVKLENLLNLSISFYIDNYEVIISDIEDVRLVDDIELKTYNLSGSYTIKKNDKSFEYKKYEDSQLNDSDIYSEFVENRMSLLSCSEENIEDDIDDMFSSIF